MTNLKKFFCGRNNFKNILQLATHDNPGYSCRLCGKIFKHKNGTYIETNMSNKIKFNEVISKIQNCVRALNVIKHKFSYQAKIMIYHALIHSHLNYCPLIWLKNQPKSKMNILKRLQNKTLRSMFCAKYNCHTDPLS